MREFELYCLRVGQNMYVREYKPLSSLESEYTLNDSPMSATLYKTKDEAMIRVPIIAAKKNWYCHVVQLVANELPRDDSGELDERRLDTEL